MKVEYVRYESTAKTLRLANKRHLTVHRFACLGPGDDAVVRSRHAVHARCINGTATILPVYSVPDSVTVGTKTLRLRVKEIETADELARYHQLEEFHYRGKVLHGRRVPLILVSQDPLLPRVLGYIELSTAFLMNHPRARVLDAAFSADGIAWEGWNKTEARRYTNLIVRIARTVVSPEFRGLGLARVLVEHAKHFAREHWHVGGLKPLFMEITADMLRYVPFVEAAGMHYIGDTEGNLARVNKDMEYLLKNYSRVRRGEILSQDSGIVDLQVFYATMLRRIQRRTGVSREHLLKLLLRSPHKLSDDHWSLLHRILRLPKPTFMVGLTPRSEAFVTKRIRALGLPARYPVRRPEERRSMSKSIEVRRCSLSLTAPLMRTKATRKIQQAFGVSRDMLTTTLFANLAFSIQPGSIVLVCGPSGAGKTTLVSMLARRIAAPHVPAPGLKGSIVVPRSTTVSTLNVLSSARPLIDSLGRVSFEDALYALNVSGLAEAHLYVKRFRELSNGQRYRAMVAKLIASPADVWIADEFCATLDPITANIVARNLRRRAKARGATVILAAANWSEFVHELRPDLIVHLRAPWDYRVFSWPQFRKALARSRSLGIGGQVPLPSRA